MDNSLFQRDTPEQAPPRTPHELISHEIGHLKKGSSVRYGNKRPKSSVPWLIALALCALAVLYTMDPIIRAWDKGDAIRVYLYLHNYSPGPIATGLVASRILSPDEVAILNQRTGTFQDYFVSPDAANRKAEAIIKYMASVSLLHDGKYEKLDALGKARYLIFVRFGIPLPTDWSFLDPAVGG